MKYEDYLSQTSKLYQDFEDKQKAIQRQYADELPNGKLKAGDIISDHMGSIKIESKMYSYVGCTSRTSAPEIAYNGVILNKDGTPTKKKDNTRYVYQSNANRHGKV